MKSFGSNSDLPAGVLFFYLFLQTIIVILPVVYEFFTQMPLNIKYARTPVQYGRTSSWFSFYVLFIFRFLLFLRMKIRV